MVFEGGRFYFQNLSYQGRRSILVTSQVPESRERAALIYHSVLDRWAPGETDAFVFCTSTSGSEPPPEIGEYMGHQKMQALVNGVVSHYCIAGRRKIGWAHQANAMDFAPGPAALDVNLLPKDRARILLLQMKIFAVQERGCKPCVAPKGRANFAHDAACADEQGT